ncbi:hypothetical protein K8I61_05780 [bacterium]|nr:hypothetical protein [bacterium]
MTPARTFLFPVLIAALFVALAFFAAPGCEGDGGDDDDDGDPLTCPVVDRNLIGVEFDLDPGSCEDLVSVLDIDAMLANDEQTYYEIFGEIMLDFDSTYYLRGGENGGCFNMIRGRSPFTMRVEYEECTEVVRLSVVTAPDGDAPRVCRFDLRVDGCEISATGLE